MSNQIDCCGRTDIGRHRDSNQDHYLIADLRRSMTLCDTSIPDAAHQRLVGDEPGKLMVVADGMGGPAGGERASSIAVTAVSGYVLNMMHWFLKLSEEREDDLREELEASLSACEAYVREASRRYPEYPNMGTTVTLAYVVWPNMYVVHAGDSRCYVWRDGCMSQITRDHSVAQLMVDAGSMRPEEANESRLRHILCNAVGAGGADVEAKVHKVVLEEDDVVLLCTDGLHGPLGDEQIAEHLGRTQWSAEQITEALVAAANEAGGPDNITAVTARFAGVSAAVVECEQDSNDVRISAIEDTLPQI